MESDIAGLLMSALRLAHSFAALVWLGGGVYFLIAIRPAQRALAQQADASGNPSAEAPVITPPNALISAMQGSYAEWAQAATLIMLASGVILIVDRLAVLTDHLVYAVALGIKVLAAVIALWMTTVSGRRRRSGAQRRSAQVTGAGAGAAGSGSSGRWRYRTELIVALGAISYALGVVLSGVSADI